MPNLPPATVKTPQPLPPPHWHVIDRPPLPHANWHVIDWWLVTHPQALP